MKPLATVVASFACLGLGCGGLANGSTPDMGARNAGDTASGASSGHASSTTDAGVSGDDVAPPPPELTTQPTVWIGQLDGTITYPESAAYPMPTGQQKVLLILSGVTDVTTGTVTFGDGNPPSPAVDPKQPYPLEPTTIRYSDGQTFPLLQGNWTLFPYSGFAYRVASSGLKGNALSFTFVPSDLWSHWCTLQDPKGSPPALPDGTAMCNCDGTACVAPTTPIRQFDLVVSGDTMQGQLLGLSIAEASDPMAMKLERVQ